MVGQRWAPTGVGRFFAVPRLLLDAFLVAAGAARHEPLVIAAGVLGAVIAVRQTRVSLALDEGHAVVRNTYRTYRVPYADISDIDVSETGRFGTGPGSALGTVRRLRLETRGRPLVVEVTGRLSDADRWTIRETLLGLARESAAAAVRLDGPR